MAAIAPDGQLGSSDSPEGFERRRSRWPLVLLGLFVLFAFVSLGYTMFARSVVYYKTPTEVLAMPGEHVRLSGTVVPGSITNDVNAGVVTFIVTDPQGSQVKVRYEGAAPDTLKDEAEAVAEGSLATDGTFHAEKLFARCPSKFAAKTPTPGA
jgi:cytochrome c-type biogenesis protein CcmE